MSRQLGALAFAATLVLFVNTAGAGDAIAFRVRSPAVARAAPDAKAKECGKLAVGAKVDASLVAGAWYGFAVAGDAERTCWIPANALEPVKTRGLPLLLVPLAVEAGCAVVKWVVDLFSGGNEKAKPVKVEPGALSMVQELRQVPQADQGIWQAGAPSTATTSLTVEVWVQKADGAFVPSGGALRLGDEYEIHARCSRDCYVRVTCETPGAGAVCQYSPSRSAGFDVSPRIAAGEDAWPKLLPPGVRFKVSEPVMPEDVIRVEAVAADAGVPFRYVAGNDKGEGCVAGTASATAGEVGMCDKPGAGATRTSCGYRGGGFSVTAAGMQNPVPDVVSLYVLKTIR
ncbi:MAG: hypothetical protein HY897_14940 [Deltaproteobacteria bacterium]|nr:hypothetical protein [Deltaproteobacteria bacterium]